MRSFGCWCNSLALRAVYSSRSFAPVSVRGSSGPCPFLFVTVPIHAVFNSRRSRFTPIRNVPIQGVCGSHRSSLTSGLGCGLSSDPPSRLGVRVSAWRGSYLVDSAQLLLGCCTTGVVHAGRRRRLTELSSLWCHVFAARFYCITLGGNTIFYLPFPCCGCIIYASRAEVACTAADAYFICPQQYISFNGGSNIF